MIARMDNEKRQNFRRLAERRTNLVLEAPYSLELR